MNVTLYHNPRCRKSRETLALLERRGIRPKIIEYLKNAPSESELKKLLVLLGIGATELVRKKEPEYKKAKLDRPNVSEQDIVRAMAKHPILIERPIVVANNKVALGRPPEAVLKIL